MNLTITRDDLLTAIDRESLVACSWVHRTDCRYCAIGAVLKRQNIHPSRIASVAEKLTQGLCNDDDNLPQRLAEQNWLAATSIKFEQLAFKMAGSFNTTPDLLVAEQLDELKPALKLWILDNLPVGTLYSGDVI